MGSLLLCPRRHGGGVVGLQPPCLPEKSAFKLWTPTLVPQLPSQTGLAPVPATPSPRLATSPEEAKESQAVLDCDHYHIPVGS